MRFKKGDIVKTCKGGRSLHGNDTYSQGRALTVLYSAIPWSKFGGKKYNAVMCRYCKDDGTLVKHIFLEKNLSYF